MARSLLIVRPRNGSHTSPMSGLPTAGSMLQLSSGRGAGGSRTWLVPGHAALEESPRQRGRAQLEAAFLWWCLAGLSTDLQPGGAVWPCHRIRRHTTRRGDRALRGGGRVRVLCRLHADRCGGSVGSFSPKAGQRLPPVPSSARPQRVDHLAQQIGVRGLLDEVAQLHHVGGYRESCGSVW